MEATGSPNQALFFVLAYLPLQQLLVTSQVCKSFRDAISDDVLIWLNLVVERPLSLRLTDQILIKLASKASGRLGTLALLDCVKITDEGLLRVVNANPLLNKLYVPGCTGLTPEGTGEVVKTLAATSSTFSSLKINGIYNINKEDFLILQSNIFDTTKAKPRFYHMYSSSSFRSLDEDARAIDVEICPKCKEVKLVFHCPKENVCKGCFQCIPRCEVCGRCISKQDEDEFGETICNDIVCLNCWLCLPKCNHCNKPFCPRHAGEQGFDHLGSQEFICWICQTKSSTNNWEEN
ncbi:hypothetical protein BVRB_6g144370 isoform A [Beta vulgaris subsp. vulgaris]|nr:hypothetical protein BVRB_6g144370 isoform A [Beta vulgaris subsp. vulgaris]